MIIQEVHNNFKFRMNKLDSVNYPDFLPEEIDLLGTQAQTRYIKQRYGSNNIKRQSFEETEKRTEDLKNILETYIGSYLVKNNENLDYNSVFVELPNNHWFTIGERAIINCPDCNSNITVYTNPIGENPTPTVINGSRVKVQAIQHIDLSNCIDDPFKGPDKEKILKLMYKNYIELILPNDCSLPYYMLRYIKRPPDLNLNTGQSFVLSDHTHDEIVDEMVKIALENIESRRNSTFTPIIDNQKE